MVLKIQKKSMILFVFLIVLDTLSHISRSQTHSQISMMQTTNLHRTQ